MWQVVSSRSRRRIDRSAIPLAWRTAAFILCALIGLPLQVSYACTQPTVWSVSSAFDLAARNLLPAGYPQPATTSRPSIVPATVLRAVGWVESGWRQFDSRGRPLVSGDFGYGIMQITSGMAGAFHDVNGSIDPSKQSLIATDYTYNIAEGAAMLASKFASAPKIGDGSPDVLEHWYYALWAYNGWGWVNNPNNPRFTRDGSPATDAASFPYQERVLYYVAHPPHDAAGNPLWQPIRVSMPAAAAIGTHPGPLPDEAVVHREDSPELDAVDESSPLPALSPGGTYTASVRVVNTGTQGWVANSTSDVSVGYHLFSRAGNPWAPPSPFEKGIVAFGQGVVPVGVDVLPGASAAVHVVVRAPSRPGTYRVAWDLVQGGTHWFSQSGALVRTQVLHVRKPALVSTPKPSPTVTPTPAPESLQYITDTSIPDGTRLPAGEHFTKGWLVFNNGTTMWSKGWQLRRRSGTSFGKSRLPVPLTAPCRTANITVQLRAPSRPGSYTSTWTLRDPSGTSVGQPLTIVVSVRASGGGPGPTPTSTPRPTPTRPTPTPTPVG